jgi:hypothetical protein
MGHVPLAGRAFLEIDRPLLQLAVSPYLVGRKALDCCPKFSSEFRIDA